MARVSFAHKVSQVTPFVTFKVSKRPTAKQRRLVNEYHRILYGYRTKDKDGKPEYVSGLATGLRSEVRPKRGGPSLEDMRALAGQAPHRYLKGVWFDTVQGKSGRLLKPSISKNRKGKLTYKIANVSFGFEPFSRKAMVRNPEQEIRRILNKYDEQQRWLIQCGAHHSKHLESTGSVFDKVLEWQNSYGNWRKWMFGLVPVTYGGQASYRQYRQQRDTLIAKRKRSRK